MTRRICIVTGTRAEYGLLRGVIRGVHESAELELQLVVTGAHLAPAFGLTYREIEADGFRIDAKVEMLLSSDSPTGVGKSMGLGVIGFADTLERLRPDVLVLLGDRYETFTAAAAAMIAGIPIAHIHGGETTEGAFDEAIRHAITKMAHLHFVAAEPYRRRVIQLGEQPERVFLVGGLGVDAIGALALLDRSELQRELGFTFRDRNLLVTFHPVTLEGAASPAHMDELLVVLATRNDTGLIFTMPNADTGNHALAQLIDGFVASHPNAASFASLGQLRYLSCMSVVDGVVGNSSSGLTEAPSLGVGTVNIGDRQKGRLRADSVIDCRPDRDSIASGIDRLFTVAFKEQLKLTRNPYGQAGASAKIVEILAHQRLETISKKSFYDLDFDIAPAHSVPG